ncbi:hypothetical protein A8C56_15805 [Niabella ginsenosidivorans]|uniref:Uncharacterized protein n=1 Tax=Niabella ginsenosidivorans TaxID=1176587 RepID=A0A1A9I6F0_9BACT|nr:hypothetical protein A8C56_15805 [Niabella ginsenosidivorans]
MNLFPRKINLRKRFHNFLKAAVFLPPAPDVFSLITYWLTAAGYKSVNLKSGYSSLAAGLY